MSARPAAEGEFPENVVVSRTLAAPRSLVFRMWTEPEHFSRWFGPHGTIVEVRALEPHAGGLIAFVHRHCGGQVMRIAGTFDEVVAPERLSFTTGFVDEHGQPCAPPMLPGESAELASTDRDPLIGGADLASHAFAAGLID